MVISSLVKDSRSGGTTAIMVLLSVCDQNRTEYWRARLSSSEPGVNIAMRSTISSTTEDRREAEVFFTG